MDRVLVWGFSNNLAGTEAVVANYISSIPDVAFDVLTYEEPTNYRYLFDGTNRFFILPRKSQNPLRYAKALRQHMKQYAADYSAVWCNLNSRANIDVIKLARRFGVPRIIAHSHNSMKVGGVRTKVLDSLNTPQFKRLITDRWACSDVAGSFMFGADEFRVLPNAIRYDEFVFDPDARDSLRGELGLSCSHRLVGTVGRMTKQKNHLWMYRMFAVAVREYPNLHLVVIGDGENREEELSQIKELGLSRSVSIVPSSNHVSDYLSAMDVFILPSLWEGLPVALLEAQANGLPCVVSDAIAGEGAISDNILFLSLDNVGDWVDALARVARQAFDANSENASAFNLAAQARFIASCFKGVE